MITLEQPFKVGDLVSVRVPVVASHASDYANWQSRRDELVRLFAFYDEYALGEALRHEYSASNSFEEWSGEYGYTTEFLPGVRLEFQGEFHGEDEWDNYLVVRRLGSEDTWLVAEKFITKEGA